MTELAILQLLGWAAIGAVMILFASTGGFDLGAGILLPYLGRNDIERRIVMNVVGPTWDGNQVWLVIVGGAIFAIWPRVYAAAFSGFYFAMLLLLWALFLRPVAFEYRSKLIHAGWRRFWDWALFIGSLIPALIIGVGIGNVIAGVPFYFDPITLRFFYTGSFWGLLTGFPLLCGLVSVCMLTMHGAAYISLRTEGAIWQRSQRALRLFSRLFIIMFIFSGIYLFVAVPGYQITHLPNNPSIQPLATGVNMVIGGWQQHYKQYPQLWLLPAVAIFSALLASYWVKRVCAIRAFIASTMVVMFTIITFGVNIYPFVMPSSTHPAQSLLIWNSSSSSISLIGILICAVIMLPIIFIYTTFVYRKLWGRQSYMNESVVEQEKHVLY